MSNFIGSTGSVSPKYFYKLTRDNTGYLVFTKVDLNTATDVVVINNNINTTSNADQLEFNISDYLKDDGVVINVDENHEIIKKAAGHTQFKIKPEDLLYFINDDGNLIVRLNGSYNYPTIV
jgi:hypothetical protein